MCDLNERIAKWRSSLAQSQTLGKMDIDELESHLREEIERLKELKLSDDEAFLVATHRLGSPASLGSEFAKVNQSVTFRHRLFWIIVGILSYIIIPFLIGITSKGWVVLGVSGGLEGYNLVLVNIVSQIVLLCAIVFLFYQIYKLDLDRFGLKQLTQNFKGKSLIVTALVVGVLILSGIAVMIVGEISSNLGMTERIMDTQEFNQLAVVWGYLRLVWSLTLPVVLVMLLIKMRRADVHEVETE